VLHRSFVSPYRTFHFKEDYVHYAEESHSAINMIKQMSSCKWPQNKVTTFIRETILTLQIQPQAVKFADSACEFFKFSRFKVVFWSQRKAHNSFET